MLAWIDLSSFLFLRQKEGEANCHLLSCGTARSIQVSSGITNLSVRMFTKASLGSNAKFLQKDKRFLALWLYLSQEIWCQFLDISLDTRAGSPLLIYIKFYTCAYTHIHIQHYTYYMYLVVGHMYI